MEKLQNFIDKLSDYSAINGLKLQPSKCFTLYLGRKNCKYPYLINGSQLLERENVRDLGIQISSDLKFTFHAKTIAQKAQNRMYLLFKSILSYDIPFLIRLYKIYVISILDCGSSVYNSNARQLSDILEKVQRRFTCLIFYRCLSSQYPQMPDYSERLKILNLESLESRRRKADLLLFHQILNGNVSFNANLQISSKSIYPEPILEELW